jgi:ferredoxin
LVEYKIEIDRTMCMACGACCSSNPAHFEPDQEGKSTVVGGETDDNSSSGSFQDEEIENAREAEDTCPASAITVTETQ